MNDNKMKHVAVVILAAGEGTRMKSAKPKVLHEVAGQTMLQHVLGTVRAIGVEHVCVVLGHKQNEVKKELDENITVVIQKQLLGSGDAVKQAISFLKKEKEVEQVFVLSGDVPLIQAETLKQMVELQQEAACTLLTGFLKDPTGYGRVIRKGNEHILKIVEEKDADIYEKVVEEVNSGIYYFNKAHLLNSLEHLDPNNAQKEYYLPDLIEVFVKQGLKVESVSVETPEEILGINNRRELARVEKAFQRRINQKHMDNGVTLVDPETIFIDSRVEIGSDTIIYPFTVIQGKVIIGKDCRLGPFTHVRTGSLLEEGAQVGNFTEVKKTKIGKKSKAKHLSYLGDGVIGDGVNIGAGTILANYDGKNKYVTIIEDGAFIGSNCTLVAPVKIGAQAITGAGSVVTKNHDVPKGGVVVGVPAKPIKKRAKG